MGLDENKIEKRWDSGARVDLFVYCALRDSGDDRVELSEERSGLG